MAQKNIVEIIFDTSNSMNSPVSDEDDTSRLEIAKYAFRKLMDDVILPSSFEYRIQYFINCKTGLVKVDDIYSIGTYGNTPLFKAIGNSLEYLFNFDKSYKKSIIILSDEEDTCYSIHRISQKEIVSFIRKNPTLQDVKIYILKIGKVSPQAEKEYKYLVRKTEGKKYLVDLKNYKKTVENIIKDLHSILNRGKIKSFFYSFLKFTRRIGFVFMSLLIFILFIIGLYDFFKHIKPLNFFQSTIQKVEQPIQEPIHSDINCTSKPFNGIAVEECIFKPNPLIKALIYDYNSSNIIVLGGFESASTELSKDTLFFLHEIFNKKIGKHISYIDIYGHADLIPLDESNQNFNECKKERIDTREQSNKCLAFRRALGVRNAIYERDDEILIYPHPSNDFFMRDTNKELGGTLWEAMDIEENVSNLRTEISIYLKIDIPTDYDSQTIRKIVKDKKSLKEKYEKRFSPFRSVVLKVKAF
jgi:hypothetical protein